MKPLIVVALVAAAALASSAVLMALAHLIQILTH